MASGTGKLGVLTLVWSMDEVGRTVYARSALLRASLRRKEGSLFASLRHG